MSFLRLNFRDEIGSRGFEAPASNQQRRQEEEQLNEKASNAVFMEALTVC